MDNAGKIVCPPVAGSHRLCMDTQHTEHSACRAQGTHTATQGHHSTAHRILSTLCHAAQCRLSNHTLSIPHAQHTVYSACPGHSTLRTQHTEDVTHLILSTLSSQHTTEHTEYTAECIAHQVHSTPQAPHSEHISQYTEVTILEVFPYRMLGIASIPCTADIVG